MQVNRVFAQSPGMESALTTCVGQNSVVVPAFAPRPMFHLYQLKARHGIPDVPVFLDSPMVVRASKIGCMHPTDYTLGDRDCRNA